MISFTSGSLGKNPILGEVLEVAQSKLGLTTQNYSNPEGLPKLRDKIKEVLGVLDDQEVIITSSGTEALYLALSNVKNKVALQTPAYFGVVRQLKDKGAVMWSTVQELRTLLEDSQEDIGAIYLTSNYNSIDGTSLTTKEKAQIAAIAQARGLMVIEDNPNDLLHFGESKPSRIAEVYDNTVQVGSFSKILKPNLLGFAIANRELTKALRSKKIDVSLATSDVPQQIALHSLNQDYLPRLRSFYRGKWEAFQSLLNQYDLSDFLEAEGGIFVRINFQDGTDISRLVSEASKIGVQIEENKYYYFDKQNRPFVRLNFVQNSQDLNEQGIERLSQALINTSQ